MLGQAKNTDKRHWARRLSIAVLPLALGAVECGRSISSSSTETNWLKSCEVDGDAPAQCGDLSCVCGVCSFECVTDADCADAPEASECVTVNNPDDDQCAPNAISWCRPIALDTGDVATNTNAGGSTGAAPQGSPTTRTPDLNCDPVEDSLQYWCGSGACHGDPGLDNAAYPPYLFPSDPGSAFVDVRAVTEGCEDELLISSIAPEKSLMITSLRQESPCGLEMPDGFPIPASDEKVILCIEQWVYDLAATARGE